MTSKVRSLPIGQRVLVIYSGVLTAAVCVAVLCGFVAAPEKAKFKEMDVQRINVVEPDGTLRMVIANKALQPQAIFRGKEYPHPNPKARQGAGIVFYNDEGTESGGLQFGGYRESNGDILSSNHFSFDQYEQDQAVVIENNQFGAKKGAGIAINDLPDRSLLEDLGPLNKIRALPAGEQETAMKAYLATHSLGANRISIGRGDDGTAALALADATGKPRLVMTVEANGAASLKFLDADGKVIGEMTPKSVAAEKH